MARKWDPGLINWGVITFGDGQVNFEFNQAFSYSIWHYQPSTSFTTAEILIAKNISGAISFWVQKLASGAGFDIRFFNAAGTNGIRTPSNFAEAQNAWSHLGLTYSGSGLASGFMLYGNGATSTMGPPNNDNLASTTQGTDPVMIGNRSSTGAAGPMFGSLADLAIWNVQLTALEMKALSLGIRPNRIRRNALALWAPLDGLASPEPDLSGFANNGTITTDTSTLTLTFGPPIGMFTRLAQQFPSPPPPAIPALMAQIVT